MKKFLGMSKLYAKGVEMFSGLMPEEKECRYGFSSGKDYPGKEILFFYLKDSRFFVEIHSYDYGTKLRVKLFDLFRNTVEIKEC